MTDREDRANAIPCLKEARASLRVAMGALTSAGLALSRADRMYSSCERIKITIGDLVFDRAMIAHKIRDLELLQRSDTEASE